MSTKPVVRVGMRTPWGRAEQVTLVSEGVGWVVTSSHGGIKLDRKRQNAMPKTLRLSSAWYEEDVECIRVMVAFPKLFLESEVKLARDTLKAYYPKLWKEYEENEGRGIEEMYLTLSLTT